MLENLGGLIRSVGFRIPDRRLTLSWASDPGPGTGCSRARGRPNYERDLLGFVDGTESPAGLAGIAAALVTDDHDPGFAGGSYVIVQKYVHDLAAWNRLTVEEQERVIGRSKPEDIEIPDSTRSRRTACSGRSCATTCRSAGSAPGSSAPTTSDTAAPRR
jgi:Dyp-type peroxidase family